MDCLITKLKAVVNNPNLPVLETLQQITKDAITLSGNTLMTEEQKYALNHFYYQLGAIDNSSLWQKIQGIVLPFLANDAAHSIADYKTNSIYNPTLESSFAFNADKSIQVLPSGGVKYYHNMMSFDFESDNLSIVSLFPQAANTEDRALYASIEDGNVMIQKKNGSTSVICGVYTSSSAYTYRLFTSEVTSIEGFAYSFGHESSLIHGCYLKTNNTLQSFTQLPTYDSGDTYPAKNNSILSISTNPSRGFIIGKAMTQEELSTVFSNLITLRAAFVS